MHPQDTSQLVSPASYDPGLPPREHATSGGGTRGPCVDSAPSQYCCRDPMSTYFMGPGGGHLKGTHRNLCLLSWKRVPTMGTEESYPTYKCPQISKVISTRLCPIWASFYLFIFNFFFLAWPLSLQDLSAPTRDQTQAPAVEAQVRSSHHWPTRQVPRHPFKKLVFRHPPA